MSRPPKPVIEVKRPIALTECSSARSRSRAAAREPRWGQAPGPVTNGRTERVGSGTMLRRARSSSPTLAEWQGLAASHRRAASSTSPRAETAGRRSSSTTATGSASSPFSVAPLSRHAWRCHAYCLMPNHYHLMIEAPLPKLSEGMHRINGAYAQWFNRRHGFDGHLFQGRFHSVLAREHLAPPRALAVHRPEPGPSGNSAAIRWTGDGAATERAWRSRSAPSSSLSTGCSISSAPDPAKRPHAVPALRRRSARSLTDIADRSRVPDPRTASAWTRL